MSGGKDNFTYSGSLNYIKQDGIVINTGKKQVGLRFNATQRALDDKLVVNVGIVIQKSPELIDGTIFYNAYATPPWVPEYKDGVDNAYFDYFYQNPKLLQMMQTREAKEHLVQTYGSADYALFKDLKVGAFGSITKFNTEYGFYQPVIPGWNNQNNGSKATANRDSEKGDIHINYNTDFDSKHSLALLGAYEYNKYKYDNYSASARGFAVDNFTNNALQLGDPALARVSSYKEEFKIISFLARATYNYDSKYYLTASIRRDGSSKFGENHAWGTFPAISAAWRISNMNFMKDVSWIDELKIKAGYGVTGNQDAIGAYNTFLTLTTNGNTYNAANNTYPPAYGPNQNPNPDLQWEQRIGLNLGVDFSFLRAGSMDQLAYSMTKRKIFFITTVYKYHQTS